MSQITKQIQTSLNVKNIRFTDKGLHKQIWIFKHTLYQLHIFDITNPYPHNKISVEHPITYYQILQINNNNYLIVVNSIGTWICYLIILDGKNIGIKQYSQSIVQNIDNQVIGIHVIEVQQGMILFVKSNGQLQYNYIGGNNTKMGTFKINKIYKIQTKYQQQIIKSKQKDKKVNLFNKYKGRQLLHLQNQNKIINSCFHIKTKQLYAVCQDINTGVCSVYKFYIQNYQVISGVDFLLNLDVRPMQIIVNEKFVVINLGNKLLIWVKNSTKSIVLPQDGYCTNIQQLSAQKYKMCITANGQSHLYSLSMLIKANKNSKDQNSQNYKFQKLGTFKTNQLILYYSSFELNKIYPGLSISNKLQISQVDKDGKFKIIFPNIQSTIKSAVLYQYKFSNLLQITKQIGYAIQNKLVTNSRIVTEVDEYQHNMLIKMANLVSYQNKGQVTQIFLSSPIIGTIKFAISFQDQTDKKGQNKQKEAGPLVNISTGSSQPNLISQQQSLYISPPTQQLTPTKILLQKNKYNISDLFQNKTDFVLAGCILGSYTLLAIEKQIHVFQVDPKPKRLHIHCFDSDIRNVYKINDVNMWAALLWDGSLQLLRIGQKESIKIKQINNVGADSNLNMFAFNIVINTAPHILSIIGTNFIICSNDQLHAYQPQKTILQTYKIPSQLGNKFYPILDLSSNSTKSNANQQKLLLLSNKDQRWMIIQIQSKYLIKNNNQIKFQVEQIIAFPSLDGLIMSVIKDGVIVFFCGNKIKICTLQTGGIVYKTDNMLSLNKNNKILGSQYVKNWLLQQEIQKQNIKLQQNSSNQNLLQTHPNFLKLSTTRILLYNQKQIWYCSVSNSTLSPISYFSMPNDAFIQFRNNLDICQLQNKQFMEIFADKVPILGVAKISENLIALLYQKMIVVIQAKNNGALSIFQQVQFSQCEGLIAIAEFIGVYDQRSLYMKDTSHRLILLRYIEKQNKYKLQIAEQLEDQIISINRVNGWKQRTKKIDILGQQIIKYEPLTIKKDGQLVIGTQTRPIYL